MKIKSFIVIVATCSILSHWDAFGCDGGIFMKEIKLTQGKVALVDDADFEWLNQWKWYARKGVNTFYALRNSTDDKVRITVLMHRVITGTTDAKIPCDHGDMNGLNNQRYNIRVCTHGQNQKNRTSYAGSSSKYKGVSFHKPTRKWIAQISNNCKLLYLGLFDNEIDAAKAYNEAAIIYHGEFARLNRLYFEEVTNLLPEPEKP